MEPNRSIVVFSSGPQGNLELLAVGGKKGGRKTTKPAKDSFQVRQQLLLGAGLGQCDEQREKTLMSSVIDANTRASDNMTALKLTQALGDKILWKGVYRGPPVVEGVNPVLGLIRRLFEFFRKEACYSHRHYPKEVTHYFRVAIETVVHRHADDYARQMQVEFDCLTAPIRHPPPEGLNYLNLRDMKTLWDYPYHRLFLTTMLDVCKEHGFDKMDRHDLNLLMYARKEVGKLFPIVVDPEDGDYNVDETVLKNVSGAMTRWGTVLLVASGSPCMALRIPTVPKKKT